MPLVSGLGWRKFASIDTSIAGVTNLLRSQLENNVLDCQLNPALKSELFARCRAALRGAREGVNGGLGALPGVTNQGAAVAPFVYEEEPTDEWRTFALMAEGSPGRTIRLDCDCVSPVWGAFFHLRWQGEVPVGVGISQPKTRPCRCRNEGKHCHGVHCTDSGPICDQCGYGMAHAYTVVDADALPREARDTLSGLLVPMRDRVAVFDGSVIAGMHRPRDEFYGSGETSIKWLRRDEVTA